MQYELTTLQPPSSQPLGLDAAKSHIYEDGDHTEADIARAIADATQWFERQTEVRLIRQTTRITADAFPAAGEPIVLPVWPVSAIDAITYIAADGTETSLDAGAVSLRRNDYGRSRLAMRDWLPWPTTRHTPDAVTIDVQCGYADADSVPEIYLRPLLTLIAFYYENRGDSDAALPEVLEDLVANLRPVDE
ncbi:head-tail connector protein [Rosistilla oblonga]|uniref:head-tail connector protein n=1 Tax=Rosistilla oblonga TaxID=2527990 RepID=UPI003A9865E2